MMIIQHLNLKMSMEFHEGKFVLKILESKINIEIGNTLQF